MNKLSILYIEMLNMANDRILVQSPVGASISVLLEGGMKTIPEKSIYSFRNLS